MGTVMPGQRRPRVRSKLIGEAVQRVKRAVRLLGEIMLAVGTNYIAPGVAGWSTRVSDPTTMATLGSTGRTDPSAYSLALSRMFGTCKMGTDPCTRVILPEFGHHTVDQLYVADASVFPANLGVNSQVSILTMAQCCAELIIRSAAAPAGHRRQA
jgi:choline dehydrogenase-like flavoprotein